MGDSTSQEAVNDFPEIAPFDPTKKKKKQKQKPKNTIAIGPCIDNSLHGLGKTDVSSLDGDRLLHGSRYLKEGNESDYQYIELLRRISTFLHETNLEFAGDRRRTVLKPPHVLPEGTAQTAFVNFVDLCNTMHRPPEHVIAFMLKELDTVGSLDGENKLLVQGSFPPKQLEDLLKKYMIEYVLCNCCKGPDTILTKESHIFLLQCDMCGTERPVAQIGAGGRSRVERRKTGK